MTDAPVPTDWTPDRKFIAGVIGGVVSWGLTWAAARFGWTVPAELQAAIVGAVSMSLVYFVPPSMYDIVKRVNNMVVAIAARTPDNPTRAVVIPPSAPPTAEAVAQAAVNSEVRKT